MKHQKLETTPDVSRRMSRVSLKMGLAETLLGKELWRAGYRYFRNYRKLPGSPDIAVKKYKIAIFIDGEFWHGKDWEVKKMNIKTNRDYWHEKIEENIKRDKDNDLKLIELGWIPIHFWEREVLKSSGSCVDKVVQMITKVNQIN